MIVSFSHFITSLYCLIFGLIFGIIYVIIHALFSLTKSKIITNIVDFILFLVLGLIYQIGQFRFNFPSVRLFMPVCVLIGVFLSAKTCKIIVANIGKKIYNRKKVNRDD